MHAFDRIDVQADGLYVLTEFESTGEPGSLDIELSMEAEVAALAIMIEGDAVETDVRIDGDLTRPEHAMESSGARTPARRLYFRAGEALKSVRIRLQTKGQKVKVSVLRVLRRFATDFKGRLSCTACKRLVRFLLVWIATSFGIPNFPMDGQVPASMWRHLRDALGVDLNGLAPIVAKLLGSLHGAFVEKLIDLLRAAALFLEDMYKPIDTILEKICRGLGFCADAAKAA